MYNVYLRYRDGSNTRPANAVIENREREFLRSVGTTGKPLLLASGPFLPIRGQEWRAFVDRVRPVFIYLQKHPEEVLDGLLDRRRRQLEDATLTHVVSNPAYGCWDQDVTTEFRDGRWMEIERERALNNVRKHMGAMVEIYQRLATRTFTWNERQSAEGREQLNAAIRHALGL